MASSSSSIILPRCPRTLTEYNDNNQLRDVNKDITYSLSRKAGSFEWLPAAVCIATRPPARASLRLLIGPQDPGLTTSCLLAQQSEHTSVCQMGMEMQWSNSYKATPQATNRTMASNRTNTSAPKHDDLGNVSTIIVSSVAAIATIVIACILWKLCTW
jgi:hypothetical protein